MDADRTLAQLQIALATRPRQRLHYFAHIQIGSGRIFVLLLLLIGVAALFGYVLTRVVVVRRDEHALQVGAHLRIAVDEE